MQEILKNLYLGDQMDYETLVNGQKDWAVVQACKEPYHRKALGYTGRGAPKSHPEYLIAKRDNRLILNLVDVDNPNWISPDIIDNALVFIKENLIEGKKVLVHCNQGMSRSAGIGLLYLVSSGQLKSSNFEEAETAFRKVYKPYNPANGMREFMRKKWSKYSSCPIKDIDID